MTYLYTFDPVGAEDVIADLTAVESHLTEVVVDLRWRLHRLHESWVGEAAGSHLVAHEGWTQAYADMHDALVAMRKAARTAHDNYRDATVTNTQLWDQVR